MTTKTEKLPLTSFDTRQAVAVIWNALESASHTIDLCCGNSRDDINTAMAWIQEALDCEELPEAEHILNRDMPKGRYMIESETHRAAFDHDGGTLCIFKQEE